jgi:lipopolysaccharide transport system ATP-binding protein
VDEVLAVGDSAFQKKCLGKMGEVAREGRTVLFVSHNMGAISNLCQSALRLENGTLADMGETESVIAGYAARARVDTPDEGLSDLRSVKRSPDLGRRRAQLEWVRTLNADLQQQATFLEQEPIIIEVGFVVLRAVRNVQLGCSITLLRPNVELFTIPSREYSGELPVGSCSIRLRIDPNYLREGSYSIGLKMFADGLRQDTISETLRFHIVRYVSADEDGAYFARWVAGPLWLPYKWEEIRPSLESVVQPLGRQTNL